MCSRAPLRVKNAQPREAPTGRAGALFHRIASSRLPVPTRGRRRRAIVRFDSIRFDSIRRPRFGTCIVETSTRRPRARETEAVRRPRQSRSVAPSRIESNLHRICIESNRRDEPIVAGRVVPSSSDRRRVSSRLVSSSGSRRRARVVSCRSHGRSPCHTRTLFHPFLIHSTTTRPTRVCVVVTSRDPCHCPCPAPVPRVCVRTRGFGGLHYEREDDAGATSVRPRARRPPRARPHPRRRHTTTTTTTTR